VHPGADGREIPIEVSIREVLYKGKPSYAVVLRDITERKQAEEAVKQSERRYRDLFNSASDAITIRDLAGNIFEVNQAASNLTGYTVGELASMNIRLFLTPESFDIAMEMQQRKIEGETASHRYELELVRKDGTRAIIETMISIIINDEQPVAVQEMSRDITERKWAEKMLKESESELSQIVEGNSVPTFVIDKEHRITHWNKACENLTGISASEVTGTKRQWSPFYPKERLVMADIVVDKVPEEEIAKYYGVKYSKSALIEGAYEAEDFFPQLGESGKWLFFTSAPLRDHAGNVVGAIETLQDITERKQAEEAVMQSERRYRDLFDSASEAIFIRDLKGRILEVNQAASDLTGYTVDELATMNIRQYLTPASFDIAMEMQRRQIEGATAGQRFELEIIRKDGVKAIIEVAIRLITGSGNGQPTGVQAIARDVTEERKMRDSMHFYLQKILVAQEEERKRIARDLHDDTSQSLLLLTHQLDAIASDPKNKLAEPVREKLNQVYNLAVDTLGSLRRYAQELRPAILDDMGLVAALEWLADKLITEDGIDADVQLDMQRQALPHEVQLVLFRIGQEALGNVKRHAEASKVVIRLESRAREIKMTIVDNGKGLAQTQVSDLSSAGKLGIMGMRERAQLLGGTLSIESELGKGTAVIVMIPLE
jgi:PAS domain S-box-containing protein